MIGVLDTGVDSSHPEFAGKDVKFCEFDKDGQVVGINAGIQARAHSDAKRDCPDVRSMVKSRHPGNHPPPVITGLGAGS